MTKISSKRIDEMCERGYKLVIQKWQESDEEMIARLKPYYRIVKLYLTTTSVKGYYNTIAMVKN